MIISIIIHNNRRVEEEGRIKHIILEEVGEIKVRDSGSEMILKTTLSAFYYEFLFHAANINRLALLSTTHWTGRVA